MILEDLWYGRLSPAEHTELTPEQRELYLLLEQNEERLLKTLNQEQRELLDKIKDLGEELQMISDYGAFQSGFRVAVQLMTAALGE